MSIQQKRNRTKKQRQRRIRSKISGTASRPRLVINRTLSNHYAQLIDDEAGVTIIGLSDSKDKSKKNKTERAKKLGAEIAQKATEKKITECVFDRNGRKYTGRVKAFADGAREGGLKF